MSVPTRNSTNVLYSGEPAAWRLFAVALASAAMVFGCQAPSQSSSDASAERDWSSFPEYQDPCVRDSGCGEILRCLEGTCEVPPAITGKTSETTPVVEFFAPASSDQPDGGDAESNDAADAPVARFFVEIADTASERSRGLMHRRTMADGWGMLFVYPDEAPRAFWMKNTLMSLDIIFISGEGTVVNVVHRAEPRTETRRHSDGPARYALEVQGGVAKATGVKAGQSVRFEHVPSRHHPSR